MILPLPPSLLANQGAFYVDLDWKVAQGKGGLISGMEAKIPKIKLYVRQVHLFCFCVFLSLVILISEVFKLILCKKIFQMLKTYSFYKGSHSPLICQILITHGRNVKAFNIITQGLIELLPDSQKASGVLRQFCMCKRDLKIGNPIVQICEWFQCVGIKMNL